MVYRTESAAQTEALGRELGAKLRPGSVVAFRGGLGMGKTAFTRGLAQGLGCTGRVTSPTFTIVNEYRGNIPLFHFDMYRLDSSDALFDIGWGDYLDRGGGAGLVLRPGKALQAQWSAPWTPGAVRCITPCFAAKTGS